MTLYKLCEVDKHYLNRKQFHRTKNILKQSIRLYHLTLKVFSRFFSQNGLFFQKKSFER